jgi:hypothetical protein
MFSSINKIEILQKINKNIKTQKLFAFNKKKSMSFAHFKPKAQK